MKMSVFPLLLCIMYVISEPIGIQSLLHPSLNLLMVTLEHFRFCAILLKLFSSPITTTWTWHHYPCPYHYMMCMTRLDNLWSNCSTTKGKWVQRDQAMKIKGMINILHFLGSGQLSIITFCHVLFLLLNNTTFRFCIGSFLLFGNQLTSNWKISWGPCMAGGWIWMGIF